MLERLKADVLAANLALPAHRLVTTTWGNVSAVDETRQWMVIKPSGVEYDVMTAEAYGGGAVGSQRQGRKIEKALVRHANASGAFTVATPKSVALCIHHSRHATIWSQAELESPRLGHRAR
ncbi:class II aldolase/adducin family protein [Escherichia coli]